MTSVLPDEAFFAGHFPGQPILPGVAQLEIVRRALGGSALREIRGVRLRRLVLPGEALELSLTELEGGAVRFELRRGSDVVSGGVVERDIKDGKDGRDQGEEEEDGDGAPLLDERLDEDLRLPHAHPARLVRAVLERSATGAVCLAAIPEASPFVTAGRAPVLIAIEAAAQSTAMLRASRSETSGEPRIGYLVAVREARLHRGWIPAECELRVTVRLEGSVPPLAVYAVAVELAGREVLTGTISTWLDPGPTHS
jgi:3-hydroxymyristoyl/3-hydroxydecanoyl-(acyl carrier protein) dehydratase